MKIGSTDYAIGAIVPASVVEQAAPLFYAAGMAVKNAPYASETSTLTDPFSMVGLYGIGEPVQTPWEEVDKLVKAASKRGEVLTFGGGYCPNVALRGQFYVAKINGAARKRHPDADDALRVQDDKYSYDLDCSAITTRECK